MDTSALGTFAAHQHPAPADGPLVTHVGVSLRPTIEPWLMAKLFR